jgi:hypothetical protein
VLSTGMGSLLRLASKKSCSGFDDLKLAKTVLPWVAYIYEQNTSCIQYRDLLADILPPF